MSDRILAPPPGLPAAPLGRAIAWMTRRPTLAVGLCLAGLILFIGFIAPFLYPPDPFAIHPDHALEPPSWAFPLGTDELGRDELGLLLSGGLATMVVALPAAVLAFVTGIAYGLAAGLGPTWADRLMMRLLDAILALPSLIVLIFFAALVTLNDTSLILLLGLISWPGLARLVRNETRAQRGRDFVLAAEQMGAGRFYIARAHLLRVMAPVLVVNGTFMIGDAIFALSALSFLGLGVQPPQVSWGSLLESGLNLIALDPWWLILPPGLLVFMSLLAASLTGQGLLRRWEPGR
ncbi:ABC transporter permease [Acidocella sp.]|jgi:peptide/nickel transport system permease protein|uniref:ABC transporter permease n=1 Tax=Acidocella sp. TaxID=50710 RepID=UPI002F420DBE